MSTRRAGQRRSPAHAARRRLIRLPVVLLVLFAVPALAFVGGAIDYTNAELTKADLQEALDAAAVSVLAEIDLKSDDEVRQSLVQLIEKHLYTEEDVKSLTVSIDRKRRRVMCRATVRVDATIASLIGPDHVDVSAMTEKSAEGH